MSLLVTKGLKKIHLHTISHEDQDQNVITIPREGNSFLVFGFIWGATWSILPPKIPRAVSSNKL